MASNNIEKEYKELNEKDEWQVLYQRIRSQTHKPSTNSCVEATKPQNKIYNRYRDVSPYDHSRIVLRRGRTDYINANLIKVKKADRQYILTQGPLSSTLSHFWAMVWEQQTKAIVMLNKLIEKRQDKCCQYWPVKIGPDYKISLEDVGLTIEYMEQQDHSYYWTRVLRLTDTESGDFRDVLQFHYITWPDFGVPSSPTAFLEFLRKVRDAGVLESDVGPAIIHCSAGIGRSGTFCLVDSCLILIEKFGINNVDVKEVLMEMREYRMGLIQTPEQLMFSYQAIIEGTKTILNQNSDGALQVQQENHVTISNSFSSNISEEINSGSEFEDDDDEPPPLPPPRLDSLHQYNGASTFDRPLPNIPKSTSDDNLNYNDAKESLLPIAVLSAVSADDEISEEDELEEEDDECVEEEDEEGARSESPMSNVSDVANSKTSSYEVRQRNRQQRKETIEAQVRDMKRRQQVNEQWTQLKRSLYIPLIIGGSLILGGGLLAYYYFKVK